MRSGAHIGQGDPACAGVDGWGVDVPVDADLRRAACVSDEELQALRAIGRKVERHYGRPQDIEWAIDRHTNRLLLLQSRPETVWSNKEMAPVATQAADPLQHVMTIFGGRK
jgi:pyruvate,water dikinase